MQKRLSDVSEFLCLELSAAVAALAATDTMAVSELRLRAGRPLSAVAAGRNLYVTPDGVLSADPSHAMYVTLQQVEQTFFKMCKSSVYAFSQEISDGYITLPGGHRVGLAGRVVVSDGKVTGMRDISSIAIRIATEHPGCADLLIPYIVKDGRVLSGVVVSPPGGGKTTILRDIARTLSYMGIRVCIIDERGELAGCCSGVPQNDMGPLCEVLDGCSKSEGMTRALRCLSPQVMIADELGSVDEAMAVLQGLRGGVPAIISLHAGSPREAAQRPQLRALLAERALDLMVMLDGAGAPGQIRGVFDLHRGTNRDAAEDSGNCPDGSHAGTVGIRPQPCAARA